MRVRSSLTPVVLFVLALAAGCGGAGNRVSSGVEARARARVAVLPSAWVTETPMSDVEPSASLARGLSLDGTMEVVHGAEVEAALDGREADCADVPECVRAVGELLSVDAVAALRLAGLGTTVMVNVRLVDVTRSAAETTRQTVVEDATAARLEALVRAIGQDLAPDREPAELAAEPWYQKWWVWTLVGLALAGGASAVVLAAQPDRQDPDFVITPP
jgi:hypothetical protein